MYSLRFIMYLLGSGSLLLAAGHGWVSALSYRVYAVNVFLLCIYVLMLFAMTMPIRGQRVRYMILVGFVIFYTFPLLAIDRIMGVPGGMQGNLLSGYRTSSVMISALSLRVTALFFCGVLTVVLGHYMWRLSISRREVCLPPVTEWHKKISVIVALYNEEDAAERLVTELRRLVLMRPPDWTLEFLFIDDGCKDQTVARLSHLLPPWWDARIVRHAINKGFGSALRTGISEATGGVVVCYDADCSHPALDIIRLVDRVHAGSHVSGGYGFNYHLARKIGFRTLLTEGNTLAYMLCLGARPDELPVISNAFRAYRAELIKSLDFASNGFGAASEILCLAYLRGARISFVDTVWSKRVDGYSKMRIIKTIREHISVLMRLSAEDA